ncbi:MAG: hypothetical protein R2932_15375 [Caldilineaceae bacterium]
MNTPLAQPQLWIALVLGLVLCVAGMERMVAQGSQEENQTSPTRQLLRTLGVVPAALLLGVGIAVVFIGILQGTFWPLFWQTAHSGLQWGAPLGIALSSTVALLLTTATFLHWTVPVNQITAGQPTWVRTLLQVGLDSVSAQSGLVPV